MGQKKLLEKCIENPHRYQTTILENGYILQKSVQKIYGRPCRKFKNGNKQADRKGQNCDA